MIRKLRKWWNFPTAFKWTLLKATGLSFIMEIILRLHLYEPIKSMHEQNHANQITEEKINEKELVHLQRIAKSMILIEKFAPWNPKCYNRALTAKRLLKRKNIDVHMHIGFRKKDDVFDGHAWITYKGKVVTGYLKGLDKYQKLQPLNI